MIDWKALSKKDIILINKIAKRSITELHVSIPFMTLEMDLTATHTNNKLRLQDFLNADLENFSHDIYGIVNNIDRNTGKMLNFFEPRFTDYEKVK